MFEACGLVLLDRLVGSRAEIGDGVGYFHCGSALLELCDSLFAESFENGGFCRC